MTEQQLKSLMVGFLHVLRTQDAVYSEWKTLPHKDKYAEFGDFIQRTMHLASAPSKDEIDLMKRYMLAHLKSEVSALEAVHPDAEVQCCNICLSTA